MNKIQFGGAVLLIGLLGASAMAQAGMIMNTLGNAMPGFNDGDTPTAPQVGTAQGGQPAPFNQPFGSDVLVGLGNFSQSWTHSYGAITDPILSATIMIGIYDHDSSATGSQLASFTFEGADLTATLNPFFEAAGEGAEAQYDVYSLMLPASTFAGLADGMAAGALSLQGPGLVIPLFPLPGPNPPTETTTNGANLIFSKLQITTQDAPAVPEPSTLAISLLGLGMLGWRQRHRKI